MTKKITEAQKDILNAMARGQPLILSKRPYDYNQHFIIRNGVKKRVNSGTVDALIKKGRIEVAELGSFEVSFKVVACLNEEQIA